ncbi:hypothetical protein F5B17DRAFT_425259 [Nemania serpens]|nr:hypothetical protein F5B17DRAFT_425259 [Nemania serpens]
MESNCVGIVKIPLSLLTFNPPRGFEVGDGNVFDIQREQLLRIDAKRVKKLARIFRNGQCEPSHPEHQMLGAVTCQTLAGILSTLQLSREELVRKSLAHEYPSLNGDFKIWCLQGKIRALAARLAFGDEAWWTIKLLTEARASSFPTKHPTRTAPSIGRKNRTEEINRWLTRLSQCKRKGLFALLKEKIVYQALDDLLPYTGLWDGLQLGNVHKHLATHCPTPMANYLRHVRNTYDEIFRGVEQCRDSLDVDTVLFLQYKCPSASTDDRELIQGAMRRGRIFVLVPDGVLRSTLLANILSLQVVIPSIRSYHQNMKYFSIAAKILQDHVECPPPRGRQRRRLSLLHNLYNDWTLPNESVIQVEKNKYELLNRLLTPQLAFVLLFLDTLRDFARLSEESPLQDNQGGRMAAFLDEQHLARLHQSAITLGFRNAKLSQGELVVRGDEDMNLSSKGSPTPADWRGGKPPISAYKELARCSFLPVLYQSREIAATPSVAFIQHDFMRSFFGTFDIRTREDVGMSDQPLPTTDLSTALSPRNIGVRARQDKRTAAGLRARIKKRGQSDKQVLDKRRLGAGLIRPDFDFREPMPLQRQERRNEGYADMVVEVEMTPVPGPAADEPESSGLSVANQVPRIAQLESINYVASTKIASKRAGRVFDKSAISAGDPESYAPKDTSVDQELPLPVDASTPISYTPSFEDDDTDEEL